MKGIRDIGAKHLDRFIELVVKGPPYHRDTRDGFADKNLWYFGWLAISRLQEKPELAPFLEKFSLVLKHTDATRKRLYSELRPKLKRPEDRELMKKWLKEPPRTPVQKCLWYVRRFLREEG